MKGSDDSMTEPVPGRNPARPVGVVTLLAAAAVWIAALSLLALGNISHPDIWWDEALQFWTAQGVGPYTPFDQVGSGLADVLQANRHSTWDPGGYAVLLHLLGRISSALPWLRLLSLAFFAGAMLVLTWLTRIVLPPAGWTALAGLALLFSPLLPLYAFELRPYSMELFFTAAALLIACLPDPLASCRRASACGWLLAAGLTSRYPACIAVLTLLLCLLWRERVHFNPAAFPAWCRGRRPLAWGCLILPVLLIGAAVAVCSLAGQWQPASQGVAFHKYFLLMTAPGLLVNPTTLLLWLPSLALLCARRSATPASRRHDCWLAFILLFFALRLLLDLAGLVPCAVTTRFNLAGHALLLWTWLPLVQELARRAAACRLPPVWLRRALPWLAAGLLGAATVRAAAAFQRTPPCNTITYLLQHQDQGIRTIAASQRQYPILRYAFEYGPLRHRQDWKRHLRFVSIQPAAAWDDAAPALKQRFVVFNAPRQIRSAQELLGQLRHLGVDLLIDDDILSLEYIRLTPLPVTPAKSR